jgi:antitoxin StbD
MHTVRTELSQPISEFKKNPAAALREANGRAMAIMTHGKATFYAVPAALFERLLDAADDAQLARVARTRLDSKTVAVDIDAL